MKLVTILATLVFATMAQASPAVGDYSKFVLTITNAQVSLVGSYEAAIIGLDGEAFKMSTTTTFPNSPADYNEESVTADRLASDADIAAILSGCRQFGGKLEKVTVPAGTFNTCALPTEDGGTIWIGQVPFGVVKQHQFSPEGDEAVLELEMFVVGQ